MTDEDVLGEIMTREGGFVNDPLDKGGATNHGITQAALSAWRGKPVSVEDVKALGVAEARAILRDRYLAKPGIDKLASPELRAAVLDWSVNSGPVNAIKGLQRAVDVPEDGVMGPLTVRTANAENGRKVAMLVHCQRLKFLGRLVTNNPTQAKFAAGWLNRVASQMETLA
mgnify:CR=1 FL=1